MKTCCLCGIPKPETEFNKDKSRHDGLTRECRECNRERCRRWYAQNQAGQQARSRDYKRRQRSTKTAQREQAETTVAAGRSATISCRERQRISTMARPEPTDYHLIRFSESEWIYVLQQAAQAGISGAEWVRELVRQAREGTS